VRSAGRQAPKRMKNTISKLLARLTHRGWRAQRPITLVFLYTLFLSMFLSHSHKVIVCTASIIPLMVCVRQQVLQRKMFELWHEIQSGDERLAVKCRLRIVG